MTSAKLKAPLLSPSFKYVPSFATDIRKTFRRAQRAMRRAQQESTNARPRNDT